MFAERNEIGSELVREVHPEGRVGRPQRGGEKDERRPPENERALHARSILPLLAKKISYFLSLLQIKCVPDFAVDPSQSKDRALVLNK